jgi:microcystin-dependent protein
MGQPFVGEIRMFGGNFPPNGWMFCDGQLVPISEFETLFNLIGTTYGGDGQETFALPDMRGRLPVHLGTNAGTQFQIGELAGVEQVTLTTVQIPQHNHFLQATAAGAQLSPAGANPATAQSANQAGLQQYGASTGAGTTLHPNTILPIGGSQPHDNMQPYLCVSFIISMFGVFPTQS